jgi:hypothetical protein
MIFSICEGIQRDRLMVLLNVPQGSTGQPWWMKPLLNVAAVSGSWCLSVRHRSPRAGGSAPQHQEISPFLSEGGAAS